MLCITTMLRNLYKMLISSAALAMLMLLMQACANRNAEEMEEIMGESAFIAYSQESLAAWGIDLETEHLLPHRKLGTEGRRHNPPHWITTADENCVARGIPSRLDCSFEGTNTVGLCAFRYIIDAEDPSRIGSIVDSTIIIRESALMDSSSTQSRKKAIFIHEVGHCLGLQHWGNGQFSNDVGLEAAIEDSELEPHHRKVLDHIMFPNVTKTALPHAQEIAAVQAVYGHGHSGQCQPSGCTPPASLPGSCSSTMEESEEAFPDTSTYESYEKSLKCYYGLIGDSDVNPMASGARLYHSAFPRFTTSYAIGNAYSSGEMPQEGAPIDDDAVLGHMIYIYKADGTEEVLRR